MRKRITNFTIKSYVLTASVAERHQRLILFILGLVLISNGLIDSSLAQEEGGITSGYTGKKFGDVCKKIIDMHGNESDYGALLTSLAGIAAILASAMGGFKSAWALLVVSIGSFILDTYRKLFFWDSCGGGGG